MLGVHPFQAPPPYDSLRSWVYQAKQLGCEVKMGSEMMPRLMGSSRCAQKWGFGSMGNRLEASSKVLLTFSQVENSEAWRICEKTSQIVWRSLAGFQFQSSVYLGRFQQPRITSLHVFETQFTQIYGVDIHIWWSMIVGCLIFHIVLLFSFRIHKGSRPIVSIVGQNWSRKGSLWICLRTYLSRVTWIYIGIDR